MLPIMPLNKIYLAVLCVICLCLPSYTSAGSPWKLIAQHRLWTQEWSRSQPMSVVITATSYYIYLKSLLVPKYAPPTGLLVWIDINAIGTVKSKFCLHERRECASMLKKLPEQVNPPPANLLYKGMLQIELEL